MRPPPAFRIMTAFAVALLAAVVFTGCTRDAQAMDARQIEQQYGVAGAYTDSIATSEGPLKGTLVPITLANGRQGHLFIPQAHANNPNITRLAEDERKRDDVRLRATEAAARKAHLVAVHGKRLIDELRTSVVRDIESFRDEFPDDEAREIVFESAQPDGGFVVRKPAHPIADLIVAPDLLVGSVRCQYRFTPTNGLPPREDRLEFSFSSTSGDNEDALQIKHQGTGQVFTGADALSEYLLTPVFSGRPR